MTFKDLPPIPYGTSALLESTGFTSLEIEIGPEGSSTSVVDLEVTMQPSR